MIIWIDGTYGVGKTSIAYKLKDEIKTAVVLESDEYWSVVLKEIVNETPEGAFPNLGGALPQNNFRFIKQFRKMIEEQCKENIVIVDMALTTEFCKTGLIDYFYNKDVVLLHFIIEANEETIRQRIKNDDKRKDNSLAIAELTRNIHYLNNNYEEAIRINTNDKSFENIVDEIMILINNKIEE